MKIFLIADSPFKFLRRNVLLGQKQQKDAKKSNFEIFESALFMESVCMPLRVSKSSKVGPGSRRSAMTAAVSARPDTCQKHTITEFQFYMQEKNRRTNVITSRGQESFVQTHAG